jgi:DNA-binding PucR family transcriptional regulator
MALAAGASPTAKARSALSVARRRPAPLTRYGEVALLASFLRDEDLLAYLTDTYLAPLAAERDGGETLRKTLCAYFAAARNVSSTAATLGVSRKTVNNRIFTIENHIGRPISTCAAELEIGLSLDQLTDPT